MRSKKIVALIAFALVLGAAAVMGIQVRPTYASSGIKSNDSSPVSHRLLTAAELNFFKPLGLQIAPLSQSVTLPEATALAQTDSLMKMLHGTSRNLQLVSASRGFGNHSWTTINPKDTQNDPHVINGQFHNIPCYLITISGVNIPGSHGVAPVPGIKLKQAPALPAKQIQVLIDATNGKALMVFAVHQDPAPIGDARPRNSKLFR